MAYGSPHGFTNPPLPAGASAIGSVDTELSAAAALSDGTSNPTTSLVGSLQHQFNGSTWDRVRSYWTQYTTDITATGNGIALNISTSPKSSYAIQAEMQGDTSTFDVRLEGSIDNSNWTEIGQITNVSPGENTLSWFTGKPSLYVRYRVAGITRVTGTLDIRFIAA